MLRKSAFALLLLALSLSAPARAADVPPIRVGSIIEMSGPLAAYGQEAWYVYKYMIDKINAEGGIKSMGGAKIETVLADDASLPARAANEARRLITEEKVVMMASGLLTPEMLAVSPVLDELKIPTLAMLPAGSASPWLFTLNFPYDRGYARTMGDFLVWLNKEKGYKIKNIAMLYSNYEAAQKVNEALKRRLPELGFTIVGEVPMDVKATDQTAAMLRLRSMKPDATAGLVRSQEGALLNQARYSLNIKGILFLGGVGGFADEQLWKDVGDQIGKAVLTRDLFGLTGFSTASKSDSLHAMVEDVKKNGHLPVPVSANGLAGAQAARVVQRVLETAASRDPEVIRATFRKIKFPLGDPDLYMIRAGGLEFGDDGAAVDATGLIVQWLPDHTQQVIYPPAAATAEPRPMQ